MNIEEIKNTIVELENGDTTFDACLKLSSLYVIINQLTKENSDMNNNEVVKEYNDILPEYANFLAIKKRYQLSQANESEMLKSFNSVCKEIAEFIQSLYSNSDTQEERKMLGDMLIQIVNMFG